MGGDKDHSQWWRDYSGEDWANDCDGDMDADGWKWPDRGQAGDHWSNWNDDHEEEQEREEESAEPARPSWWGSGQHHQHEQWQADMDEEEEKWAAGSVKVPETWAQYRKAIEKRGRPYPNANVAKVRRQTKRQTEREMQYFYEKKERHLIKKHEQDMQRLRDQFAAERELYHARLFQAEEQILDMQNEMEGLRRMKPELTRLTMVAACSSCRILALTEQIEKAMAECGTLHEQLQYAESHNDALQKSLNSKRAVLRQKEASLAQNQTAFQAWKRKVDWLRKKMAELQGRLDEAGVAPTSCVSEQRIAVMVK